MKLIRSDPTNNMHRFYEVHVQSTLLDRHSVVITWGSMKSRYHRVRLIKTETKEEAEKIVERILEQKIKKGYQ